MQPDTAVCGLCDQEVGQVNNHVRMSSDDVHGPQGAYPENWDPSDGGRLVGGADQGGDDDLGRTALTFEPADVTPPDAEEGDDALPELELADDPADARTYDCGGCGATVEFLGDCDDCGEELAWGAA